MEYPTLVTVCTAGMIASTVAVLIGGLALMQTTLLLSYLLVFVVAGVQLVAAQSVVAR